MTVRDPEDLYALIADWWGEALNRGLIERIVQAPSDQLEVWAEAYSTTRLQVGPIGALPPGQVRVLADEWMPGDARYADHLLPRGEKRARALALYAHQIAAPDPVLSWCIAALHGRWSDERERLEDGLELLRSLEPLAACGALYWLVEPWMRAVLTRSTPRNEVPLGGVPEDVLEAVLWQIGVTTGTNLDLRAVLPFEESDVRVFEDEGSRLVRYWERIDRLDGTVEAVLPNPLAVGLAQKLAPLLETRLPSPTTVRVSAPASLGVPLLLPSAKELALIRGHASAFAEWRLALQQGLVEVLSIPDDHDDWPTTSRGILHEHLAPLRERVQDEVREITGFHAMRIPAVELSIASVGLGTGAVVGGTLLAPISTLAVTTGLKGAFTLWQHLKERREGKALLQHCLSFSPTSDA